MTENDFQLPWDESKLEFIIHNFWIPEWYNYKIKNYIYNLENFDSFYKQILQIELSDDASKDMIKDLLIVEIIVSTMFLAESFAAIAHACYTNPKDIQNYLKEFNATKFYSTIGSKNDDYLARILSIPQIDHISGKREEITEGLKDFKEYLYEFKEYYFSNLDLFNSYKHGLRIFPMCTFENNNEISIISYFSKSQKKDEMVITRMDKNPKKHQKLANEMSDIIRKILESHKNKLKNPDQWKVTIPMKSNVIE